MLISFCSQGGNTASVANFIQENLQATVDFNLEDDLDNHDTIILGSYTWGNGKIPKQFKSYIQANAHKLKGKRVFIFGTGNSQYPIFCGAVDGLRKICIDSGAEVIETLKLESSIRNQEVLVSGFVERIKEYIYA